jgi:hypothetical protein
LTVANFDAELGAVIDDLGQHLAAHIAQPDQDAA